MGASFCNSESISNATVNLTWRLTKLLGQSASTACKSIFLSLIFTLLIQGCGQQGPLYLPGDEPPIHVEPEDGEDDGLF